jgi:hypothetical protein
MYKQIKKFEEELDNLDLTGRDSFYTHLLQQEIGFWLDGLYKDELISLPCFRVIITTESSPIFFAIGYWE